MKTLVLGLGNPILTDDGVGVRVAEAVRAKLPPDSAIEVSEVSVGGLRLMERVVDKFNRFSSSDLARAYEHFSLAIRKR